MVQSDSDYCVCGYMFLAAETLEGEFSFHFLRLAMYLGCSSRT